MMHIDKKIIFYFSLLMMTPTIFSSLMAQQSDHPLKGKKVLFVYGGWEGHDPVLTRDLFVPWMRSEGAEVVTSDNLDVYTDSTLMNSLDLVVQIWTMGTITKEQEKGLLTAVKRGVGLAGWHGGIGDAFRNNVEFQFMVGGQWVAHPGGVIHYEVNITDLEDKITKGLKDFHMNSEQYYMHVDPNVKVLATTTFSGEHAPWIEGAVMPVVWKKMYGKGRVFYSSLGHVAKDFEGTEVLKIMQRGIRWAAVSLHEGTRKMVAASVSPLKWMQERLSLLYYNPNSFARRV